MHRHLAPALGALLLLLVAGCSDSTTNNPDGGSNVFVPPFTPSSPEIARSVRVTFSGETFGVDGLPYSDCSNTDPFFVDGWSVFIDEYLVVIDNIRLNATAGNVDQTNVGALVATSRVGPG